MRREEDDAVQAPRRRWRFGPRGIEEDAPPPASPREEPSFDSAAIERAAEAHFTPAPEGEEAETACREPAIVPEERREPR